MSEEKYNIDEYPIEEELEEVMKLNQEQVKIIEDLQQKVEQLEKENKELNRFCELYVQSLYNADLTKAEKRVEQLENIRKEAIDYIKARSFDEVSVGIFDNDFNCKENLLNILNKGSEFNVKENNTNSN